MSTNRQLPTSKHFKLQQLSDGVFAAIHIDGGAAIGNAGIIDLGGRTLVFDTFFTPQAGHDLRNAAEALTDHRVDVVVNSHYHNDHIWGNQVFSSDTDIISTVGTRRLILATRGHDDYDSFLEDAEENLESTLAQYQVAEEQGQRRQLALWIDYHQGLVEAKPILQVRPPNLAFTQRVTFHGTDRSAELIAFARGHSESDAVLFLSQEGVVFMSDLLFIDHHPWVGAGDPDCLCQILDEVSDLDPRVLVPGHGPVGTRDSLMQMSGYIKALDGLARMMVETGEPEEMIDGMAIPAPYNDWLLATFYPLNLHLLYQHRFREQTGLSL